MTPAATSALKAAVSAAAGAGVLVGWRDERQSYEPDNTVTLSVVSSRSRGPAVRNASDDDRQLVTVVQCLCECKGTLGAFDLANRIGVRLECRTALLDALRAVGLGWGGVGDVRDVTVTDLRGVSAAVIELALNENYVLTHEAEDDDGEILRVDVEGTLDEYDITIEDAFSVNPAEITILVPADGATVVQGTVTVSGTVVGPSVVPTVDVVVTSGRYPAVVSGSGTSWTWTADVPLVVADDEISAVAEDDVGDVSATIAVNVLEGD